MSHTRHHTFRRVTRSSAVVAASLAMGSCSSSPPTGVEQAITSVVVTPSTAEASSLRDTVRFSAEARTASGQTRAVPVTWSSSAPAVLSIDGGGVAVARANGVATVSAQAEGISGHATVSVDQVADSIAVDGDAQGGQTRTVLDTLIVATVYDARGNPVPDESVAFAVTEGGGSIDASLLVTDALGQAAVAWTMGDVGAQQMSVTSGDVSRFVAAVSYPGQAASMSLHRGQGQIEIPGHPLPDSLSVLLVDSLGNPVPDVLVVFTTTGDGTLSADTVWTNLDGLAEAEYVLGPALGPAQVLATVPDSAVFDIVGFPGSPVTFSVEAVDFTVDPLPASWTAGDTVDVTGTGFHPVPDSAVITLDGVAVEVLGGSQTALTLVVPSFGCVPRVGRTVSFVRETHSVDRALAHVPAGLLELAVGEQVALTDPSEYCLQLPAGNSHDYLVGLTSTRWLDAAGTFVMSGLDSIGPLPAPAPDSPARAAMADGLVYAEASSDAEAALRTWEAETATEIVSAVEESAPSAAPPMGAPFELRVPNILGDPCTEYQAVTAEVFYDFGQRISYATTLQPVPDLANPLFAPILNALQELSTFEGTSLNLLFSFIGDPAGWLEGESRFLVVFTPAAGDLGVSSFSTVVDQLPRSSCAASDEGLVIYVDVPANPTPEQFAALIDGSRPTLAHDIAHVIQAGRRLAADGALLPGWLAEGHAQVTAELIGRASTDLWNVDDVTVGSLIHPDAPLWFDGILDGLAFFNGWDGAGGKVAEAPERCSLFGFVGPHVACEDDYPRGAAWSLTRYLTDRFGGDVGGQLGFLEAVLDLPLTASPLDIVQEATGASFEELMVQWAAALYVDGLPSAGAVGPEHQITSWNLHNVLETDARRLLPPDRVFADFTQSGSLLGGGTAYSRFRFDGQHGPLAIAVTGGLGGEVSSELAPRLWVLRVN